MTIWVAGLMDSCPPGYSFRKKIMEIILILTWFVVPIFCAMIASEKNRSIIAWFVLGIFFHVIAMLAIIGLSKLEKEEDYYGNYFNPKPKPKIMDMSKLTRNKE